MARSLNGNLRGRAARFSADELADLQKPTFSREYMQAVNALRDLMGEPAFEAWYDSYPRNVRQSDFLLTMQEKIEELTREK